MPPVRPASASTVRTSDPVCPQMIHHACGPTPTGACILILNVKYSRALGTAYGQQPIRQPVSPVFTKGLPNRETIRIDPAREKTEHFQTDKTQNTSVYCPALPAITGVRVSEICWRRVCFDISRIYHSCASPFRFPIRLAVYPAARACTTDPLIAPVSERESHRTQPRPKVPDVRRHRTLPASFDPYHRMMSLGIIGTRRRHQQLFK